MLMIVLGAGCLLLSVLFHAASLLHLGLPLLYALLVPTLFPAGITATTRWQMSSGMRLLSWG